MSLRPSYQKMKRGSSSNYDKKTQRDEKAKPPSRLELKKSLSNLPKCISQPMFAENSGDNVQEGELRSRDNSKEMLENQNERIKTENFQNPPFLLSYLPSKADRKLIEKLRVFGFKGSKDFQEAYAQSFRFQGMLKVEPVKLNSSYGPQITKPSKESGAARQQRNHRTYKKAGAAPSVSFERHYQNSELKVEREKFEREIEEKEEALKKTLAVMGSSNSLSQQRLQKFENQQASSKDKKAQDLQPQKSISFRSDFKEAYWLAVSLSRDCIDHHDETSEDYAAMRSTEPDQRLGGQKKEVIIRGPSIRNQRFAPLAQIKEVHNKNASNIATITVAGNRLQGKGAYQKTGENSPLKNKNQHIIDNEPAGSLRSPPKTLNQSGNVLYSFRDNMMNRTAELMNKNPFLVTEYKKLNNLQKLLEHEIFENLNVERGSIPGTPHPPAAFAYPSYPHSGSNRVSSIIQFANGNQTDNQANQRGSANQEFGINGTRLINRKPKPQGWGETSLKKAQSMSLADRNQVVDQSIKSQDNIPQQTETNPLREEKSNVTITANNSTLIPSKPSAVQNKLMNIVNKNEEVLKRKSPAPVQPNFYKYIVGKGNNAGLIRRVLKTRSWWEETPVYDHSFNLRWQQTSRGFKFEKLIQGSSCKQLVNHFEYHSEITTKNGLIKSLSRYCDANKVKLYHVTPTTFVFDMDDEINFDTDMQRFAKFFIKHYPDQSHYPKPDPNDKKNPDVWYNFDYRKKGKYHPPALANDKKPSVFLKPKMRKTFLKGSSLWVLKPTGLNRGRGIEVFNSLEDLNEMMNQYFSRVSLPQKKAQNEGDSGSDESEEDEKMKRGRIIKSRTFVIQKYIEDLFLINNRKFDIRVWALVTHDMQLYFFKEGYLRTCSEEYKTDDRSVFNKFVHLTNNAIQRYGENYGNHESGNQLSFKDLEKYAETNGLNINFRGYILPRMKELIALSFQSAKKTINMNDRKYSFEVFGFDFMIDAEYKVWLIEINTNPCLDESSPLLKQLIPRMIDDAFKLTVDVVFPQIVQTKKEASSMLARKKSRTVSDDATNSSDESESSTEDISSPNIANAKPPTFSVDGYDDSENMWEHLCSIQYEKPAPKKGANKVA